MDSQQSSHDLTERASARAHGPKYQIYSFRGTASQKALLDYASEQTNLSRQRILNQLVWTVLEKEYGQQVPIAQGSSK